MKLRSPLEVVVYWPAAFLERTFQKYRVAAVNPLTVTFRFVPVEMVGEQPGVIEMQY